jgi:hypothetical protein
MKVMGMMMVMRMRKHACIHTWTQIFFSLPPTPPPPPLPPPPLLAYFVVTMWLRPSCRGHHTTPDPGLRTSYSVLGNFVLDSSSSLLTLCIGESHERAWVTGLREYDELSPNSATAPSLFCPRTAVELELELELELEFAAVVSGLVLVLTAVTDPSVSLLGWCWCW